MEREQWFKKRTLKNRCPVMEYYKTICPSLYRQVVMTPPDEDDGKTEASLFEAISHDTRIRALFLLQNNALGFSELKHQLGIKSSGNLQHHLTKLGILIEVQRGLYSLSDNGREAILAIEAVRRMQNRKQSDRIIITMVYAFSLYAAFMNVPFLLGTVDASTPFIALGTTLIAGFVFYLSWPFAFSRWKKEQAESKS